MGLKETRSVMGEQSKEAQIKAVGAAADMGSVSDGYHTFDELYKHRAAIFACLCSCVPGLAWKSRRHADGTMDDGFFIAGINVPEAGTAAYHIREEYWPMFRRVRTLPKAPKFDGHTPDDDIERLLSCFTV